jgi:hypothetical protein
MTIPSHSLFLIVERSARRVLFCLESQDDCVILSVSENENPLDLANKLADWLRASGAIVQIEEKE